MEIVVKTSIIIIINFNFTIRSSCNDERVIKGKKKI